MKQFSKFVGLDVHKETIAVAVAEADGGNGTTGTGVKLFSATNTLAALTEQLSHASPSARESGGIPVAGGVKALKSGGILSSRTDCAKGPIRAPSLCLRSFRR